MSADPRHTDSPPKTPPQPIHLKDYKPPAFLVDTVSLDVALDPNATIVRSRLGMRPNPEAEPSQALVLDGEALTLEAIAIDGEPLPAEAYETDAHALTIYSPPSGPFTLELTVRIDPESNTTLSGLYRTQGVYCTQCEPHGFRRITYFPDRPDIQSIYTVRLECDWGAAPTLLANGNPVENGPIQGTGRHYAVWHDPHRKPSYLFAMVGGDLACVTDSFTTMSGRDVELCIYVEHGKEDRTAFAMESLKKSMRWDEERFGREYDLDIFMIVAVSDFNMGAMENKGLNVFNDKLVLARPDTATDADYGSIEGVIAHEYFHNWSGNRVTCRDWFQLCLKEGLTVFRDQEFTSDLRSGPVKRIMDVRMLKTHQFPEDMGPLAHPVRPASFIEINNFYTATVYEKGAELCRMLQTMLGREAFRKGLDLYFERHDGHAATVEDFVAAMADSSGRDLTQFMRWYSQAGTPELACELRYDAASRTAELDISQVQPQTPDGHRKEPLQIPVRLGLVGGNGADLPLVLDDGRELDDGLIEVTEQRQKFRFKDIPARPAVSILRDFSAPVQLRMAVGEADLARLMAHDSDPFNRWQASQTFALDLLSAAARSGAIDEDGAVRYARALETTITDEALESAYRAETLKPPSESDIARELGRDVDPDAIHSARRSLKRVVGTAIAASLHAIHDANAMEGPFAPDAASAGRRALRNAALDLIAARGEDADMALVRERYADATNMTDAISALAILTHVDHPARQEALDHFEAKWREEALVLDKWFAVQAMSSLPGAPARVAALLLHPKFSLKTPNRVRALVGTFGALNPTGFNDRSGEGYALVADIAAEIDGFNPQVAARMLGAFKSWRLLEEKRAGLARAALEKLVARGTLSRNAYEIVSKTLG